MNNSELINSVDLSKLSVRTVADQLIELAEQGNPLEVKLKLKAMSEAIDEACKKIDKMARDEAEKHGAKTFDFMGCSIGLIEAGTKYDFSNCGDIELEQMTADYEALAERIKKRKDIVKNIDSKILLQKSFELIRSKGYSVVNVDSTLCLEAPKIKPWVPTVL